MKKALVLLLALAMVLSLAACGSATTSAGNVGHVMLNGFGHKRLAYFLRRYG